MLKHAKLGFCLLILLSLLPVGMVTAVQPGDGTSPTDIAAAQEYLREYGYLDSVKVEPGVLDQPTRAALQQFQSLYHLDTSGQLDAPTRDLMSKPRYDHHPDAVAGDYVLWPSKWNKTDLTYGFQNFTPDISQAATRNAIAQAFGLWAAETPLTFTEVPVTSASNPDIIIVFGAGEHGDGHPFDGQFGVLAHAFFPGQGNISGDAHFDEDENWTVTIPTGTSEFDLVTVAAHEFGHSLGLNHSEVTGALMAPFYGGPHRFLHADDIAGIQAHYGPNVPPPPPPPSEPMYVDDVNLTSETITNRSGGTTFRLTGQVTVHSDGSAVSGASVSASLTGPGTSQTLNATTNTSGVANFSYNATQPGNYTLTVTGVTKTGMTYDAGLNVESSASVDTDGGSPPPPPPPPPPGDDPMYVNAMTLSSQTVSGGRGGGTSYQLTGQVTIHADGATVSGATVTASLTGPGTNLTLNALTNASGVATFNRTASEAGQYTLTVTNVTKSGMTYDSGLNVVSSAGVDTSGGSPPPPPPPPPGDDAMYVGEVDLSYQTATGRGGTIYKLSGEVTVLADGSPVNGATVTVNLTGPGLNITLNAITNTAGVATYNRNATDPGTYTLTVTNVSKSGVTYDDSLNVDDSDSVNAS